MTSVVAGVGTLRCGDGDEVMRLIIVHEMRSMGFVAIADVYIELCRNRISAPGPPSEGRYLAVCTPYRCPNPEDLAKKHLEMLQIWTLTAARQGSSQGFLHTMAEQNKKSKSSPTETMG